MFAEHLFPFHLLDGIEHMFGEEGKEGFWKIQPKP